MADVAQVKSKAQAVIDAALVTLAIELGLEMLQLAAAVVGLPIPRIRRANNTDVDPTEANVESSTLEELHGWASDMTDACIAMEMGAG